MSGLNYSNLIPHLRFGGKINKFSKYKFNKIPPSTVKENPLILEENYFITIGEEGSILKLVDDGKLNEVGTLSHYWGDEWNIVAYY